MSLPARPRTTRATTVPPVTFSLPRPLAVGLAGAVALGGWAAAAGADGAPTHVHHRRARIIAPVLPGGSGVLAGATTTATAATATTTAAPTTTVPAAPGLVRGKVTAIGDSVMIDYAPDLVKDLPGVQVEATVGEQWDAGLAEVATLRAEGALGAQVIVGLGTNGPVSITQFDQMRAALAGVPRVVFVTVHVDQPWQGEVNGVLAAGVRSMPQARLANWYAQSASHPGWFYSDGTHLPIGGTGAQALASLVVRALHTPAASVPHALRR